MAILGGIKFFSRSQNLASDGATILASSGDASSIRSIDRNPITYWRSVSSNDLTTETITVTFSESKTIDRLLLVDHNWKAFNVKYFSLGSYVHFSSVFGLDGSQSNITETTFADNTAYYEFASVATTSIQITITSTQVANAEKYISQIISTLELGTLQGYPRIANLSLDRNARVKEMLSGRTLTLKSEQSFEVTLEFKDYPARLSSDIDLMQSLYEIEENFIIWLCGGRRTSTYFKKILPGFRLKDVFQVQTSTPFKPSYSDNIYTSQVNFVMKFTEEVD
jgi:hypothetical protein